MHPGVLVYALKALEQASTEIIGSEKIKKAGDTIMACAVVAAIAGVGSGWLPGAGALVASAAWVATIWGMYVKINKDLGISIKDNVLKSLASAILTNILAAAGSLVLMLVGSFILSFFPLIGQGAASVVDGIIGYITVFASGVLYIRLLTKLFKAGNNLNFSEGDAKKFAKDIVEESNISEILEEGKKAYKDDKKAGKFKK